MLPEIKQLDLSHVYVKIAQPLVYIPHVLLLEIFKFVRAEVNITVQKRHFKLACRKLKFSVDDRECSPTNHLILTRVLARQVDQFE